METETQAHSPLPIPPRFVRFFKFCTVGLFNTGFGYLLYSSLVYLGLHYIAANTIGFIICVFISFLLNRKFVFKFNGANRRDTARALLKTYATYTIGLVIGNASLYVLVDLFNVSKYIAPLCLLPFTTLLNYTLINKWAFGRKADKENT